MPSIPQSLLWISLVVLWLFVLVPMLVSKREAVRRTSDVALATRVLNGAGSRLLRRGGPAAGHRSDPHWKPKDSAEDDLDDAEHAEDDTVDLSARPVVMRVPAEDVEPAAPEVLDVDAIEDSAALPAGTGAEVAEPTAQDAPAESEPEPVAEAEEDDTSEDERDDDRYEYVEDSSGLEPERDAEEPEDADPRRYVAPGSSRRRRFDTTTAAAVSARKYAFRKRVLMVMAAVLIGSAVAAFEVTPSAWWVCGTATAVTMLYLIYLRRQTRIEERVRRRRMQRMARARLGVENAYDRDYDVVPSRLRRPGAVVLEIDDEDPIFEHLDNAMPMPTFGWPRDLPRAVGE
ncbi:divisome protein SepX/GlpR [Mycobacterium palustre]|uniref:Transmembrane protein n=1 Tax=Mycobacterium palustre TaxID=153971 RepID=A0A1X1ZP53_9MYCO|nr:gephyrin-like molybdotransferase receptor GlpR [Mycobacterium palustre]MCV7102550.1 hypothetical protein [Mycobacterium palustre]ORW25174.1 hypothetical protein AWC19_07910 [Mycobacterium palustre]